MEEWLAKGLDQDVFSGDSAPLFHAMHNSDNPDLWFGVHDETCRSVSAQ